MAFPLFEKVGGQEAALALLAAAHMEPSKYALDKWRSLGFLPAKVAVQLMFECQRRGMDTNEADLRWTDDSRAASAESRA